MKKRILAAALWFYALWCLGAAAQLALGIPQILGIAAGLAAAYLLISPAVRARAARRVGVASATPPSSQIGARDSL
jgi:hypothetical protein